MGSHLRNRVPLIEEDNETAAILKSGRSEEEPLQNDASTFATKNDAPKEDQRQSSIPLDLKAARATLYMAYKALNIVYVPIFIYRMFEKRRKCTAVSDPILRIPAVELARKIRKREVSCEEVIQAYISRIKEVNPLLNAIIDDRFPEALEDARKVDAMVSSGAFLKDEDRVAREYPLLGVPVTIKGSIAVKGLKHTSGTVTRKEHRADQDADVVALVKKAGAIPLLVSNVPELCMNWETSNKLIGTTNNPHDTTRTPGGSSGGEASLLGSGASLLGIGSDLAGSLRLPAHYCGVWGHKPTPGTVSFEGHHPSCLHKDRWESIFTLGPMARYAADIRILFGVIAKPEKRGALRLNKMIDLKKIKVYYSEFEGHYWDKTNRNCVGAVRKVVDHFRKVCDVQPEKFDFRLSEHAPDLASFDILTTEDIDDNFDGNANGVFIELLRYATFRSGFTFMAICCGMFRRMVRRFSESRRAHVKKYLARIREEFLEILGEDSVVILPSFATEAVKHGDAVRTALCAGYFTNTNALGFPVTNCPVGVTDEGLPVGVQVAAPPYGDNLTLAVAEEIERAFGGWIEPTRE